MTYRLNTPKGQVQQLFDNKGEAAARKLAEKLEVANYRTNRWMREWTEAKEAAEKAAKRATKKSPAKKAAMKKAA